MFYLNTTREIEVGDRVVGRGVVDGYRVEGLRGTVTSLRDQRSTRDYVVYVHFDDVPMRIHSHWWLYAENFVPEDAVAPRPDGAEICYYCGGVVNKRERALTSRLYKRECICPACLVKELGQKHEYHFAKHLKYNVDAHDITIGAEVEIDAKSGSRPNTNAFCRDNVKHAMDNGYAFAMSYEYISSVERPQGSRKS